MKKALFAFCLVVGLIFAGNDVAALTKTQNFAQSVSGNGSAS